LFNVQLFTFQTVHNNYFTWNNLSVISHKSQLYNTEAQEMLQYCLHK